MRQPHLPIEFTERPFTTREARESGLTPRQLQSECWRRLLRDVYVLATIPDSLELRIAAVSLVLPPTGVVSGGTAAWVHGVDVRRSVDDPVEVTVPRGQPLAPREGLRIRRALLPDDDLAQVGGIAVTTALRTGFDLARRPDLTEAVVALDALLHAGLLTVEQFSGYLSDHPRWRGIRWAGQVVDLADGRAESPMESRMRCVLILGGLPRPDVQVVVLTADGLFIARLDLGYRPEHVGLEYDGARHRETLAADLARQNALVAAGWLPLRYTGLWIYQRSRALIAQVAHALDIPVPPPARLPFRRS